MGLRDFLRQLKDRHRKLSRARSETGPIGEPSKAALGASRHTGSTPTLRIGDPNPPTPGPSTFRTPYSNDSPSTFTQFQPDSSKKQSTVAPRLADPAPGLYSVAPIIEPSASHDQKLNDLPSSSPPFQPDSSKKQNTHTGPPNPPIESPAVDADKATGNLKSLAYSAAKTILLAVRESADSFVPLKSVAGGLCFILDNYERTKANKQSIETLAPRVQELATSLCAPVSQGDIDEQLRRGVLERKLQAIDQGLELLIEQGKVEGFLTNVENADKIRGLVEDIRDALIQYQTSIQQAIHNKSCQLIESVDLTLLNGMYHASDAGYDSGNRQGCLRGTRQDVLGEIQHWLMDEQDKHVFWLNGLAGTGKTTLAQTFAETSFADGKLGASFFCSRDFADRSDLQAIFPTLAFQLAYKYPSFRQKLLQGLKAIPDIGRVSLCSQMEKLIIAPFKASPVPTLIIIDALDECKDEEPASAILSILSRYTDQIPNVKFFITGRPEPRIRSGFRLESLHPITEVLKLHEVEQSSVDADINLYLRAQLAKVAKARSDCNLTNPWPASSDIDVLCKKAAGLFIYASTVIKFVASPKHLPTERLTLITSLPQDTAHEGKSGIDHLYSEVLRQAFHEEDSNDEELSSSFKSVLGTVVLVFNHLTVEALSDLLKLSKILTTLRHLHSLLIVPDTGTTNVPVRPFHKSFPDFLTDTKRCGDQWFVVEPEIHAKTFLSCLELMKERLKRNICGLDDFVEVKDLSTQQRDKIGDALEYACQFWPKHLLGTIGSSSHTREIEKAINEFSTTSLLDWIEVLVLMGKLDTGVYAMNDVEKWGALVRVSCKWANDAQRFLLENFDAIHHSPS